LYEADWYWELQTDPLRMEIRAVPWLSEAGLVPSELRMSVPVEEDPRCPADN